MDQISFADPLSLLAIALTVAMGGILKGATGAGAPIIAVPVIAAFYDVRVDARTFDLAILVFLGVLAMPLIWTEIVR